MAQFQGRLPLVLGMVGMVSNQTPSRNPPVAHQLGQAQELQRQLDALVSGFEATVAGRWKEAENGWVS